MSAENRSSPLPVSGRMHVDVGAGGADASSRRALIAFGYYFACIILVGGLIHQLIPDRISFTLFGHLFSVDRLHHHIVAGGAFTVVLVPAVFAVELAVVGWPTSSLRDLLFNRSASCRSDLVVFLLWQAHVMNICKVLLTFGAALLSGVWVHDQIYQATGFELTLRGLPAPLSYAGYFLLYTFFDYWNHRLDHTRYFWPIHRYHHSAEEFYILTSDRGHPGNFSVVIATTLPLGLIDAPLEAALWLYLVMGAEHLLAHSRIDSDFGWIGRFLVQSPVHHRLHHILDTTWPTSHYSFFPLWDRLFGTWRGGSSQRTAIGVNYPYRHGAWVFPDLWRDYREFLAGFISRTPRQPAP